MKDVLGQAISDYYPQADGPGAGGKSTRGATSRAIPRRSKLWVHTSLTHDWPGDKRIHPREEMPVKIYFRSMEEMPELEWIALQQCRGKILDIGAGAGSHALALQQLGQDVTALEISPLASEVIKARGVKKVLCEDVFRLANRKKYDTLLLMMNGIGLTGTLAGLRDFLRTSRALLRPGGHLVFDSCDIVYLYGRTPPPPPGYYGELLYRYEYRRQLSDPFNWLFIDRKTLAGITAAEGWQMEVLYEDGRDQFLVKCW
jgi:SAM-dependent methyltransferase